MCNLYNVTKGPQAVLEFTRAMGADLGNLQPGVNGCDQQARRQLRAKGDEVDFAALLKLEPDAGTTNVRNVSSTHWKRWLGPENRCVVPATSFSEYGPMPDPVTDKKPLHWFAIDESEPLFVFAGIWTP